MDEQNGRKTNENNLKRGISSESEDEGNTKKVKSEDYAAQAESSQEDDVEMDEEPEPEGKENGNDETRNEGENENTDEEKQKEEEKERMERETRNKSEAEAKERADREEFRKKMAEEEEKNTIFIKGRHTDITAINAGKATKEIGELIGRAFSITKSRDSLRFICKRPDQKENMMSVKTILGHDVIISEPHSRAAKNRPTSNRGIIFGVSDDVTDEEMTEALGVKAERIIKRRGGEKVKTRQMILHFEDDLPQYVRYEWQRFRVSIYIPEVVRCYKCRKFGYTRRHPVMPERRNVQYARGSTKCNIAPSSLHTAKKAPPHARTARGRILLPIKAVLNSK